jgi:hypothetical protein
VAPDNSLDVGELRIDRHGRFATTIYGDSDYTSVLAAGGLTLDGDLSVDVQGDLSQGTELTIMEGARSRAASAGYAKGLSWTRTAIGSGSPTSRAA